MLPVTWPSFVPPARLMGVVNVTPDSFSDGGRWLDVQAAVAHAEQLVHDGAAWLDIGGESTRPGAVLVPEVEELRRVLPVISALAERRLSSLSIDTRHASVARAALAAGAAMVNDISAGADPAMLPLVAEQGCLVVLMHMQGDPTTMQQAPRYADVLDEVSAFGEARLKAARLAGVKDGAMLFDPGIGFGKTIAHNLALLRGLPLLASRLGVPLVVGVSRKRFLGTLAGIADPAQRDGLSHVVHALIAPWCAMIRVHDVAGARAALAASAASEAAT